MSADPPPVRRIVAPTRNGTPRYADGEDGGFVDPGGKHVPLGRGVKAVVSTTAVLALLTGSPGMANSADPRAPAGPSPAAVIAGAVQRAAPQDLPPDGPPAATPEVPLSAGEVALARSVSPAGPRGVPEVVLAAYRRAADLLGASDPGCHLDWSLLAGIGRIESGHASGGRVDDAGTTRGRILGPRLDGSLAGTAVIRDSDGGALDGDTAYDRAVGPMQFLPGTWRSFGADGSGDAVADPHNVVDAALAAGRYLCAGGGDLREPQAVAAALFRYNRSTAYGLDVLAWAEAYRTGVAGVPGRSDPVPPPADPPANPPADPPPARLAAPALDQAPTSDVPPPSGDAAGTAEVPTGESMTTTAPGTTTPGTTAPGTTAPGTTAPGTTAPGTTAPGTTAPGTTTPGTTTPGTTTPTPTGPACAPTTVDALTVVEAGADGLRLRVTFPELAPGCSVTAATVRFTPDASAATRSLEVRTANSRGPRALPATGVRRWVVTDLVAAIRAAGPTGVLLVVDPADRSFVVGLDPQARAPRLTLTVG